MNEIKELNSLLNKYAKTYSVFRNSRILTNENLLHTSIVGILSNDEVYGVLPSMNIDKVKKELILEEESPLLTVSSFEEYLNINIKEWNWGNRKIPDDNNLLAKALLGKCLLSISNQFYVDIKVEQKEVNYMELINVLNSIKVYHQLIKEKDEVIVRFHGRLTKEQEEILNNKYSIIKVKDNLIINLKNNNRFNFKILYKELTTSEYLYSGVITNLDSIKYMPINDSNKSLSQIETKISKTTFATVIGLGHPQLSDDEGKLYKEFYLKQHPLLIRYFKALDDFDKLEAKRQRKLFNALNNLQIDDSEILKEINEYLIDSYYPHIISIAGNIITSDDYNLYLNRGINVEHENLYSCAVTGYSEIYDNRVRFYDYSVEDDKPSIKLDSKIVTFNGEFVRETRAELGITTEAGEWKNYGIIVSGKENNLKRYNDCGLIQPLTVDFEVASQVNTRYRLEEIIAKQKNAIESGEASSIYGLKLNVYENIIKKIKNDTFLFLQEISKSKDLIIIGLLISINIKDMVLEKTFILDLIRASTGELQGTINFIINIVLLILFILDLIKMFNSRKNKWEVSINKSKFNIFKINSQFSKKIKIENSSYVLISMINLYLIALKNNKN